MKHKFLYLILCVLLSAGAAYLVAEKVFDSKMKAEQAVKADESGYRNIRTSDSPRSYAGALTDFSDAAEMAVQTVVYVKVVKRAKAAYPNSMFDLLFGFAHTPQDQVGLGSGVIIRPDGYIVTNNHVISGADEIEVTLENNRVYPARLVGTDPSTDIALLKIDEENLPCIPLGDSDNLRLGEWVLAIGSPYDLRSTITAGIVSAKGRSMPNFEGQSKVESFIQTDAAVNPGNSGGALVNLAGELVGINTSIISKTGSYTGYSFAVPVNIVKKIADDFINYGEVKRGFLGISMTEINSSMARQLGLSQVEGVYVAEVQSGSAAEAAGIQPGDVIVEINLIRIRNAAGVQEQMSRLSPGDTAAVTVLRDGEQKEFIATLH